MKYENKSARFWDEKYLSKNTGWDLGGTTPIFKKISKVIPVGKICILGCGKGYDAVMFAEQGFKVTAVDFSREAIKSLVRLKNKSSENLKILQENIFNLDKEFFEYFDYVIEQTCFCAIHPTQRLDYVSIVKNITKRNGKLIGLWFPLDKKISEGGPPYGTSVEEVKSYFSKHFQVEEEEFSKLSVSPRINREKLIIFKKL